MALFSTLVLAAVKQFNTIKLTSMVLGYRRSSKLAAYLVAYMLPAASFLLADSHALKILFLQFPAFDLSGLH